jgi:hypothetical protein
VPSGPAKSGSSLPINDACLRDAAVKQFGAFLLEGTHKCNSKAPSPGGAFYF